MVQVRGGGGGFNQVVERELSFNHVVGGMVRKIDKLGESQQVLGEVKRPNAALKCRVRKQELRKICNVCVAALYQAHSPIFT